MPNPSADAPYPFSYDEFQRRIGGLAIAASELQGSLCGYLCAGGVARPGRWLESLQIDAEDVRDLPEQALESLRTVTMALLDDPEMRFTPFLPDESTSMAQRIQALSEWCAGFLGGFGLTGLGENEGLSEQADDALRDLERIAHFGYEPDEAEADENALAEIVEYVRVATLLLFQEAAQAQAPDGATRH
jgi:hypothetical protein